MSQASPPDVRHVIDTDLSDEDIQHYIDDVNAYITEEGINNDITDSRQERLEKYAAALRIRMIRERAAAESSVGDSSVVYEGLSSSALKAEVSKLDPSGTLASTVIRSDSANVKSTSEVRGE